MNFIQPPEVVRAAYTRIHQYLHLTPVIKSETLNKFCGGHRIYFKVESFQKTGAFKVRGVLNHLLELQEKSQLPNKIVGYSTGNHGIGLAFAAQLLKIQARIYLPSNTAHIKQQASKYYGGEIIYTKTRQEAEDLAKSDGANGFYYLHPSDSDSTIAGSATMCFEALQQLDVMPDAIFASCGGGGLISGTYLAKTLLSPTSLLIACEPEEAKDAYLSLQQGRIYKFTNSPNTVADGLRTLCISERTFSYLKKVDDIFLAGEESIYYWTAWLMHLLKISCEPSCALNMIAVQNWLKKQTSPKNVLVLISGGNIDHSLYTALSHENYLSSIPVL